MISGNEKENTVTCNGKGQWTKTVTRNADGSRIYNIYDSIVCDYTWVNDNITKQSIGYYSDGAAASAITYGYEFDNKINPYKGVIGDNFETAPELFSNNNFTSYTISMGGNMLSKSDQSYTYDGDYPATVQFETERTAYGEGNTSYTKSYYTRTFVY